MAPRTKKLARKILHFQLIAVLLLLPQTQAGRAFFSSVVGGGTDDCRRKVHI